MGAPVELLVTLGTSASFLAGALSRWLIERERQRRSDVTIKVTGSDGHEVVVSARGPDTEPILRTVLERSVGPALPDSPQDR